MRRPLVALIVLAILSSGCADLCIFGIRRERANRARNQVTAVWTERLNSHAFTRDDAIRRYGPPAQTAELSDGSTVDVWLWDHGTEAVARSGPVTPYGTSSRAVAVTHLEKLTLSFAPDGILNNWSWNYQ